MKIKLERTKDGKICAIEIADQDIGNIFAAVLKLKVILKSDLKTVVEAIESVLEDETS